MMDHVDQLSQSDTGDVNVDSGIKSEVLVTEDFTEPKPKLLGCKVCLCILFNFLT